jgi:hypothetical protein
MLRAGFTFTEDDIKLVKAKRSSGEDAPVDDVFSLINHNATLPLDSQSQSDIKEGSNDLPSRDSFPHITERSSDEGSVDDDGEYSQIEQRSGNVPVDDSFPYITERSSEDGSVDDDDEYTQIEQRSSNIPSDDSFPHITE